MQYWEENRMVFMGVLAGQNKRISSAQNPPNRYIHAHTHRRALLLEILPRCFSTPQLHPHELLDICCKFLPGFLWPPDLWVSKELTCSLSGSISKDFFFFFNGFLLVSLVYATDKSSLSSLDCLSSIVDRITNSEQPGLPLQDPASLSPVASTDSQPATPGASSSRLIYHVLWTKSLDQFCQKAYYTGGRRHQKSKSKTTCI